MNDVLIRKEVWLLEDKISPLQKEADRRKWSLKKYMEWLILMESERLEKKQSVIK